MLHEDAAKYNMTEEEISNYLNEICEQEPDMPFTDYLENIKKYLILCPWMYKADEADKRIEFYKDVVKKAYDEGQTVADIALDIGYVCG